MTTTIEAVYERGVFRPKARLPLKDGQTVRLTVATDFSLSDAEFTALASEETLSQIWDNPIEDEAWGICKGSLA
jgi:predicted DNA-binding antitoxin AbrB/MazE fold protein